MITDIESLEFSVHIVEPVINSYKNSVAALVGLLLSGNALTHHAAFPRFKTREGIVSEVHYRNPHVMFLFTETDDNGAPQTVEVETLTISRLAEDGWYKDTMQPGDHVRVAGHPAWSDSNQLMARIVTVNGIEIHRFDVGPLNGYRLDEF